MFKYCCKNSVFLPAVVSTGLSMPGTGRATAAAVTGRELPTADAVAVAAAVAVAELATAAVAVGVGGAGTTVMTVTRGLRDVGGDPLPCSGGRHL